MGKKSKVKGTRYEREVVNDLISKGIKAERTWGSNGRTRGLPEEVDIVIDGVLRGQCKRKKAFTKDIFPCKDVNFQFIRADQGKTHVVMDFETFITLLRGQNETLYTMWQDATERQKKVL